MDPLEIKIEPMFFQFLSFFLVVTFLHVQATYKIWEFFCKWFICFGTIICHIFKASLDPSYFDITLFVCIMSRITFCKL